jgi:hypothetical protein
LARDAAPLVGNAAALFDASAAADNEAAARITVGKLAAVAAASALSATAPASVAEAFARTRVMQSHAALYGADGIETGTADLLLQRALPE